MDMMNRWKNKKSAGWNCGVKRPSQWLLSFCILWLPLVSETALAQSPQLPEMVVTQLEVDCATKKNRICFYSSGGTLKDGRQAEALGIALLSPENGKIESFSVYKIVTKKNGEPVTVFRCDNIQQPGTRRDYTKDVIDEFFNQSACSQSAELISAVKEAFDGFLKQGEPQSATQLAQYLLATQKIEQIGNYATCLLQKANTFIGKNSQPADTDLDTFTASVQNFVSSNLRLEGGPPPKQTDPLTPEGRIKELQTQLAEVKERTDSLEGMRLIAFGLMILLLVGIGGILFFFEHRERNEERRFTDRILAALRASTLTRADQDLDNILRRFDQTLTKPDIKQVKQDFRNFYDDIKRFRAEHTLHSLPKPVLPPDPPPATDFSRLCDRIICDSSIKDPAQQVSYIDKQVAILRTLLADKGQGHTNLPLDRLIQRTKVAGEVSLYLRHKMGLTASDENTYSAMQNFFRTLDSVHQQYVPEKTAPNAIIGLQNIKTRLFENSEQIKKQSDDYQKVNSRFSHLQQKLKIPEMDLPDLASQICGDYLKACKHLHIEQLMTASPLAEQIEKLGQERREIEKIAAEACPKNNSTLTEHVRAVSDALGKARSEMAAISAEVKAGKDFGAAVADYLNFQPDSLAVMADRLNQEATSRKIIRLHLTAACIALPEAQKHAYVSRPDIVKALKLTEVVPGLMNLVKRMQELEGEKFWTAGLWQGFKDQWLHWLLRANLLMPTYFSDVREEGVKRLGEALSDTSHALESVLREFDVTVGQVLLLKPRSDQVGPDKPDYQSPFGDLHRIPEAAEKVNRLLSLSETDFIVDVKYFPFAKLGESLSRGHVLTVSPQSWSSPQDPAAISTSEAIRE